MAGGAGDPVGPVFNIHIVLWVWQHTVCGIMVSLAFASIHCAMKQEWKRCVPCFILVSCLTLCASCAVLLCCSAGVVMVQGKTTKSVLEECR